MNKYAAICFGGNGADQCHCLLQIKDVVKDRDKLIVLAVLVNTSNMLEFMMEDGFIVYMWGHNMHTSRTILDTQYGDRIMEFEDEDTALLWYKLNY